MPKKPKENLAIKEAEIRKLEDLNRREQKALEQKAELIRQRRELERAEETDVDGEGLQGTALLLSDKFAEVLDQVQEDGRFIVARIENGREMQVGAYSVSDWPARMEEIAHEAGGGTFKIQFRTSAGKFVKQITQTFDPTFYRKKNLPQPVQGTELVTLLPQLQQQNMAVLQEMRREMTEMMKLLITTRSNPESTSFMKSAQDIVAIAQLFKGQGSDKSSLEMFQMGLNLARELAEGKEPSSTWAQLFESVGKPMAEALAKVAAVQAPAPVRPAAAPKKPAEPTAAAPAPAAALDAPKEDSTVSQVKTSLFYKLYVPQILAAARKKEDAAAWAEKIVNTVPEPYHGILVDIAEKPDLVPFLAAFEPEAEQHAEWVKSLADNVLALFEEEPLPAAHSENGHHPEETVGLDVK